jgi:hypothetical protein
MLAVVNRSTEGREVGALKHQPHCWHTDYLIYRFIAHYQHNFKDKPITLTYGGETGTKRCRQEA